MDVCLWYWNLKSCRAGFSLLSLDWSFSIPPAAIRDVESKSTAGRNR